jgi:hypothetical protein
MPFSGPVKHKHFGADRGSPKRPPSRRSSFHTTICVLEGLLEYERAGRKSTAVAKAPRGLKPIYSSAACSARSEPAKSSTNAGSASRSPCFGTYDILRGLDYLRNAGIQPGRRVKDAIEIVIERRHQNGRWPLNLLHPEHIPLEMETGVGSASRWNTLRAIRVLRWYKQSPS